MYFYIAIESVNLTSSPSMKYGKSGKSKPRLNLSASQASYEKSGALPNS